MNAITRETAAELRRLIGKHNEGRDRLRRAAVHVPEAAILLELSDFIDSLTVETPEPCVHPKETLWVEYNPGDLTGDARCGVCHEMFEVPLGSPREREEPEFYVDGPDHPPYSSVYAWEPVRCANCGEPFKAAPVESVPQQGEGT